MNITLVVPSSECIIHWNSFIFLFLVLESIFFVDFSWESREKSRKSWKNRKSDKKSEVGRSRDKVETKVGDSDFVFDKRLRLRLLAKKVGTQLYWSQTKVPSLLASFAPSQIPGRFKAKCLIFICSILIWKQNKNYVVLHPKPGIWLDLRRMFQQPQILGSGRYNTSFDLPMISGVYRTQFHIANWLNEYTSNRM